MVLELDGGEYFCLKEVLHFMPTYENTSLMLLHSRYGHKYVATTGDTILHFTLFAVYSRTNGQSRNQTIYWMDEVTSWEEISCTFPTV